MNSLELIKERIAHLESRVKALEDEIEQKNQIIRENTTPATISAKQLSDNGGGEKRAKEGDAKTTSTEEPPAKKVTIFPAIGEIVEKTADDKDDAAGENAEEDADDALFDETGVRTTAMGVTEIQSLCLKCEENGVTKLLMTKIPFFREVILMSFQCPHCGHRDVQIKPGCPVQDKGQEYVFKALTAKDLSRQIIKSDSCTVRVEELDFEIPPGRGVITNLEGLLTEACESLLETQERRMLIDGPDACAQIEQFVQKLKDVLSGESLPVTVIVDDPAGNSYVDNPYAPKSDPQLKVKRYIRTRAQQEALGLQVADGTKDYKSGATLHKRSIMDQIQEHFTRQEVLQIPSPCPNCKVEGTADTCIVTIPFFKEVIIMAFNCEECGFRDTEIKGGGAIPKQGRKETLHVLEPKIDLVRDVIKSDTAGVIIPELDLELTRGSLGGMYTTVEGLLQKMMENLFENRVGDSGDPEIQEKMDALEQAMRDCLEGRRPFTLIVQDPLANSYVYSPFEPPETDPRLKMELYDRSWEEDEELGLHDMNVDDVELAPVEDAKEAGKVFQHLQPGQKDTHPHEYAKGDE